MRNGLDTGIRVDGGMSQNNLLCQTLADITGITILKPKMTESTAFGAAMIAAYHAKIWDAFGSKVPSVPNIKKNLELFSFDPHDPMISIMKNEDNKIEALKRYSRKALIKEKQENDTDYSNSNERSMAGSAASSDSGHESALSNHFNEESLPELTLNSVNSITSAFKFVKQKLSQTFQSILFEENDDMYGAQFHRQLHLNHETIDPNKFDVFYPSLEEETRLERINTWSEAVKRCRKWVHIPMQEQKRTDYYRLSALPVIFYGLISFAICIASQR